MGEMNIPASGITQGTPSGILFGACTVHKNLKYDKEQKTWNFKESLTGATKGGSKFEVKPVIKAIEIDGATVAVRELQQKLGEKATVEVSYTELTEDVIKSAVIGEENTKDAPDGFTQIDSKALIVDGDYWDNIALVGKTMRGEPIIFIMENALCTSGLSVDTKDKDSSGSKLVFECTQTLDGQHDVLPYHILYPKRAKAKGKK